MNWDMIGALGEIVGAGGVIITLGYLASQIRASRRQAQLQAGREARDRVTDFVHIVAGDAEVAQIWLRGTLEPDKLEPVEYVRFGALLMQLTTLFERVHHLALDGEVDEYLTESNAATRRDIVSSPGYRAWFETRKHWFSPEFCAVVEREMAAGGSYAPMGLEIDRTQLSESES